MRKNITRMLYGLAIIIAAVCVLLNEFNVIDMTVGLWEFWPMLIIIAGVGAMISDKPNPWNIILLSVGVFFQLLQFGLIQSEMARTVALCLLAILFGAWLMFGWIGNKKKVEDKNASINQTYMNQHYTAPNYPVMPNPNYNPNVRAAINQNNSNRVHAEQ